MSLIYILLVPIFLFSLYKSILQTTASFKSGNKSKLKADLFFLSLIFILTTVLVFAIESK